MSDFVASMPPGYRQAFGAADAALHAAIVQRRAGKLAHAELYEGAAGSQVCLVADDRTGLLALITDALLVHGLRIRNANVYCRTRADGVTEAVDFLGLHQPDGISDGPGSLEVDAAALEAFVQTLEELIAEDIRASSPLNAAPAAPGHATRVYFELDALRRGQYALVVEATDSDGLLHAITSALYAHGVRITGCQIATDAGLAYDRFDLASPDAEPLSATALCDIQLAVLDALPDRRR